MNKEKNITLHDIVTKSITLSATGNPVDYPESNMILPGISNHTPPLKDT